MSKSLGAILGIRLYGSARYVIDGSTGRDGTSDNMRTGILAGRRLGIVLLQLRYCTRHLAIDMNKGLAGLNLPVGMSIADGCMQHLVRFRAETASRAIW
jgi:hypothetical protein